MPRLFKTITASCAVAICLVCGIAGNSHAAADGKNTLIINYFTPDYTNTVEDGSEITIHGTIEFIETRDKHSGSLYKYATLHTQNPYRLKQVDSPADGDGIDDSNVTPTTFIQVNAREPNGGIREFTPYLGRYVTLVGKIVSTNGGGPMLQYTSITITPRDD
mgnify:CR=1 FL=1